MYKLRRLITIRTRWTLRGIIIHILLQLQKLLPLYLLTPFSKFAIDLKFYKFCLIYIHSIKKKVRLLENWKHKLNCPYIKQLPFNKLVTASEASIDYFSDKTNGG